MVVIVMVAVVLGDSGAGAGVVVAARGVVD